MVVVVMVMVLQSSPPASPPPPPKPIDLRRRFLPLLLHMPIHRRVLRVLLKWIDEMSLPLLFFSLAFDDPFSARRGVTRRGDGRGGEGRGDISIPTSSSTNIIIIDEHHHRRTSSSSSSSSIHGERRRIDLFCLVLFFWHVFSERNKEMEMEWTGNGMEWSGLEKAKRTKVNWEDEWIMIPPTPLNCPTARGL